MESQTKIYTMHTAKLEDPAVFKRCLDGVSKGRREKIGRIHSLQEKRLSLASSLLIDEGLRPYGFLEKDMDIKTGEHGKPYFANEPSIHFSISHSGELSMAVFSGREIGCDIQMMKDFPDESRMFSIAKRFYTKKECQWITSSEISFERKIRFYRLWVLKESYAKATGMGMALALKDCGFLMDPAPVLEGEKKDQFRFLEYSFGGYRAAVCLDQEI